jgi:hypothetical protein
MGVVVLGMHRSGTSAAALVLESIGLRNCAEEHMGQGQRKHNARGNRENRVLQKLNTRLLRELGGSWSAPPDLGPEWFAREPATALLPLAAEEFDRTMPLEPWVWKDPRLCLTLPWWEAAVLPDEPVLVLTHRNPLEVAESLQRRNGFSIRLGLALWERYTRAALDAAHGHRAMTVDYDDLVHGWRALSDRLWADLTHLGISLPPQADQPLEPVDPSLRTATSSRADLDASPDLSSEQRELVDVLDGLPVVTDRFSAPRLPPETPWVAKEFEDRRRVEVEAKRAATQTDRIGIVRRVLRRRN